MPAGDEVLRVSESGSGVYEMDQIRSNSVAVIEDHHLFNTVRAGMADKVRPKTVEELLASDYDLEPQPLAPGAVQEATQEAEEALLRERERAGGIVSPSAPLVPVPEVPEDSEVAAAEEVDPSAITVAGVAPPPPAGSPGEVGDPIRPAVPSEMVDFYRMLQRLEGRLQEMEGAISGLHMRLSRDRPVAVPEVPPVVSSPKDSREVESVAGSSEPPSGAQQGSPSRDPRKIPSHSERRAQRTGQAPIPGLATGTARVESGAPESAPLAAEEDPLPRVRLGSGRKWEIPSGRWLVGSSIAAGVLVCLGLALAAGGGSGQPSPTLLVERQIQGVGTYVRAEEQALNGVIANAQRAARELPGIQVELKAAQTEPDRVQIRRRIEDAEIRIERAKKASSGLQALESVSGIRAAGKTA